MAVRPALLAAVGRRVISKISTRLSRTLAFGVAFTVNHDSRPATEKVPTDTSLALTLDVLL